jgi:uncharacterized protein
MFFISDYEVRDLPSKGKGVFASQEIEAGTIIGDYLGMIADEKEEHKMEDGLYSMTLTETEIINPPKTEPGIYLINHSCMPNLGMYSYHGHTLYAALRKIFPGEELTVDYYLGPPDDSCSPCPDVCHCGTFLCRGTMHSTQESTEVLWDYDEIEEQKRGYAQEDFRSRLGTMLEKLASYPEKMEDHPIHMISGSLNKKITNDAPLLPQISEIRALIRNSGACIEFSRLGLRVDAVIRENIFGPRLP